MINNEWDIILKDVFESEQYLKLQSFLEDEYANNVIYPTKENIFNALKLTSYNDVKVVIIGQDPYHEPNQAHGLAFSVLEGIKLPPSLKNIYKELYDDLGIKKDMNDGNLLPWFKQGVMLLNTGLTVEKDKPNSHKNIGWHEFTDAVIKKLNEREKPLVFLVNRVRVKPR